MKKERKMTEEVTNVFNNDEVLENISDIFARYGIRSCSMDDIARHLKISKKTLYGMFENKNDVVDQVMQYRTSLGNMEMNNLNLSQIEPIPFLFDKIDSFTDKFAAQLPNNFYDVKKYHPDVYKKHFKRTDKNNLKIAIAFLDKGIADGVFRENINKELTMHAISRQVMGLADPDIAGEINLPIGEVIVSIMESFIRSIATPKGVSQLEEVLSKRNFK